MIELILMLSAYNHIGYPQIIIDDGLNKTEAYNMVYVNNYSMYHKVDKVHFSNVTNESYMGWINYRYRHHKLLKSDIIIYNNYAKECVLLHELGHNYHLKQTFDATEQSANNYMVEKDNNCWRIR